MREEDHRKDTQAEATDPLDKTGTQTDAKHEKDMCAVHKITSLGEYITGQTRKQDSIPPGTGCFADIAFQKPACYTAYRKTLDNGANKQWPNISTSH